MTPWIIAEDNGKLIAGHCDCMAGLGESCSHVASLLWAVESAIRKKDSLTVTEKKSYWVMPSVKVVPYSPIKNIKFDGKKSAKAILLAVDNRTPPTQASSTTSAVSAPVAEDINKLYDVLSLCSSKPAILALVEPYCNDYIPKSMDEDLPSCLMNLYNPDNRSLNYNSLMELSSTITITVTPDEVIAVEVKTRDQSRSRLWFRMRSGRITASKFKVACCTDPSSPALSLIMSVCYPEKLRFTSDATSWGCSHETAGLKAYEESMSKLHADFKVHKCGLYISKEYPFLGASPDGVVSCLCCNKGICEVKVRFIITLSYN